MERMASTSTKAPIATLSRISSARAVRMNSVVSPKCSRPIFVPSLSMSMAVWNTRARETNDGAGMVAGGGSGLPCSHPAEATSRSLRLCNR